MSDADLLRAVANGDQAAFQQLVERHIDALFRYALRLCGSHQRAEDLCQDTWLKVWTKADSFNPRRSQANTWLFSILHNGFVDSVRKHSPALDNEAEQLMEDTNTPEKSVLAAAQNEALEGALANLPESQRAAVLLHYFQGFTNAQVAQIMDSSERAVESLIARAKRTLTTEIGHV